MAKHGEGIAPLCTMADCKTLRHRPIFRKIAIEPCPIGHVSSGVFYVRLESDIGFSWCSAVEGEGHRMILASNLTILNGDMHH